MDSYLVGIIHKAIQERFSQQSFSMQILFPPTIEPVEITPEIGEGLDPATPSGKLPK